MLRVARAELDVADGTEAIERWPDRPLDVIPITVQHDVAFGDDDLIAGQRSVAEDSPMDLPFHHRLIVSASAKAPTAASVSSLSSGWFVAADRLAAGLSVDRHLRT